MIPQKAKNAAAKLVIIQEQNAGPRPSLLFEKSLYWATRVRGNATIPTMRFFVAASVLLLLSSLASAQEKRDSSNAPKSVTVPAIIDHNRVIIDTEIVGSDGAIERVPAWLDNGNPDLQMSMHLARLTGSSISCDGQTCFGSAPAAIIVGGMRIPLGSGGRVEIPLMPDTAASLIAPGLRAEITIPSTVLRHYDVLIDYPGKKVTIGSPGSIQFRGSNSRVQINAENGLIQVPSEIEKKKINLALDVGSSISFLSDELFSKLANTHPDWPQMTGAVGSANMWGLDDELKWKLMRIDRVRFGSLFLTDVPVVDFPKDRRDHFVKRAGIATAGILGGDIFLNYRVGLDYARSMVYFEIGTFARFPEFDVIGLVLRPEDDGRFTILSVVDSNEGASALDNMQAGDSLIAVDGIPVRGSTMGQVWAMLGGTPGQERKLTIEREGKQFAIAAKVQHFLPEVPDQSETKKKKK
jgi:hypothetical protein